MSSRKISLAQKASHRALERQVMLARKIPSLDRLYDAVAEFVVIINQERQIIFLNKAFADFLKIKKRDLAFGQRIGELLHCVHAFESGGGCGTSDFCSSCGALQAMIQGQNGRKNLKEYRVTTDREGNALEFLVQATPLRFEGESFTILAMKDISHEKRRRVLERIFFHDTLNTALSLQLAAELLEEEDSKRLAEVRKIFANGVQELIEAINDQKILALAENHELRICPEKLSSQALLEDLTSLYRQLAGAKKINLIIDPRSSDASFFSDRNILLRVLGNMVKNAIEASKAGQSVSAGCQQVAGRIEFWVKNSGEIPQNVRLQLFQRSFSTKGLGRGIGTYSMKLLGEKYLKGAVSFRSSQKEGTTFLVSCPVKIHP